MTITYLDQTYPGFAEYVERCERGWAGADTGAPPYAHPVDGWITAALNAGPIRSMIQNAIDMLVSMEFGPTLAQGITLGPHAYPELFETLAECARILDIPLPHAVITQRAGGLNASTAGTDDYSFIMVSPTLSAAFPPAELRYIIGHECGHVANRHMQYHTVAYALAGLTSVLPAPIGPALKMAAGVPLSAWSRRSEVTADRAGLLCCRDASAAQRALLRLMVFPMDISNLDLDQYLQDYRDYQRYHGTISELHELTASHPMIPRRMEALRLFASSELYYRLTGLQPEAGQALLSADDLNRRVDQIVRP